MKQKLVCLALVVLCACKEEIATLPEPVSMTEDAIAHYCMMNIAEHPGPKAQIFLDGFPDPIFFAQVRDAFTYLASAEQDGYIAAVYVSNMADVPWSTPGADNWMLSGGAWYVVGSERMGGMGVPEIVPFASQSAAQSFAESFGGEIYQKTDVPSDAYLAPVEYVLEEEQGS
ncbi:nitrous oxide reductase accessory protein NosL [Primorskyibacter sp. S187A]|uniref:nitrous oxide reductase accessory protein NosL n=1 Tax=Primorskyibacter sp. S187A TaxID=3415130 RepID=UPI003C7CEB52